VSDILDFERLRIDDSAAFEALFRRHAERLCSFARRYVGSPAEAEELPVRCHEVFFLVDDEQLSYTEVGEVLGIAPKTPEIPMARALARRVGPSVNINALWSRVRANTIALAHATPATPSSLSGTPAR
jgi:hypothetical protein